MYYTPSKGGGSSSQEKKQRKDEAMSWLLGIGVEICKNANKVYEIATVDHEQCAEVVQAIRREGKIEKLPQVMQLVNRFTEQEMQLKVMREQAMECEEHMKALLGLC